MVFEKVKKILMDQLGVDAESISMDSAIIDDLEADSLDIVDLAMTVEEEFDVEMPDDRIEDFRTVGDVVKYIEENI